MSSALSFTFENKSLTILGTVLNPLFVAKQVCLALGFKDTINAVKTHCDPEDVCKVEVQTNGGKQLVNCVNESGLYALIFGSKLPKAKQFKRWVTNEVLPAIRRAGRYEVPTGDTITNAQQVAIQQAVARRAKKTAVYYQTIYRAIKVRYQIPRYTELKQSQFEDCLRFIETVDLSVPEAPTTTPPETERPQRYVVYADFLKTMQVFCYYQRYLFRKPLMQAMRVMLALDVPDASKLWDVVNNLNFVELERSLDDLGFSVKDLDCYKHWALTHAA
ncbi:BRO family protein [Parasutterella sp.]|jgi:prophage antirepressor-like protein|uniref:BRO family protein n=1 Tax=Parasutterella sp. TaxID=2049037 RepID=UPI002064B1F1|nr:MAG TPA: repressor domain protein [Caudoviricetes sp.]